MAQDARLDLGRYIRNPFNRQGQITKRLDFDELFRSNHQRVNTPGTHQDLMSVIC
jgi:hypothetical protein